MGTRPPWEDYGASGGPWEDYAAPGPDRPALLGGGGATMSATRPNPIASAYQEAARKLKEAIFGHPDRAEAKETGVAMQPTAAEMVETGLAGGAAMLGGATAGGLAAHPVRAGMALAGSYAGEKGGSAAGKAAEAMGAPRGTAEALGMVGAVAGGGAGASRKLAGKAMDALEVASPARAAAARRLMGTAGAEAAPAAEAAGAKVLQMPTLSAKAQEAMPQAQEIEAKIVSLRSKSGLSGAQITSAIRQLYPGYRPVEYQRMVDEVLKAYFSKGVK